MTIRVGIDGFGRVGRLALRAARGDPAITFVRINDPAGDAVSVAHLLDFDSLHGRWKHGGGADDALVIDARIAFIGNRGLTATDWAGCDVAIEWSGRFRQPDVLQPYRDQGVDAWYDNDWGDDRTAEPVRLVGTADR